MEQHRTYSRDDVLQLGFEAICTSGDGTTYLWHGRRGLRVDPSGRTILLLDGAGLPESPWSPTAWGEAEIGSRIFCRPLDEAAALPDSVSAGAG